MVMPTSGSLTNDAPGASTVSLTPLPLPPAAFALPLTQPSVMEMRSTSPAASQVKTLSFHPMVASAVAASPTPSLHLISPFSFFDL